MVRAVLERGALLENETFTVARKILRAFADRHRLTAADWLVLNGLPRHIGQATDLAGNVALRWIVHLECDAATVQERLRRNTGGDRANRADDLAALVAKKLADFQERTLPLIEYYRQRRAHVLRVPVAVRTGPDEIAARWRAGAEHPPGERFGPRNPRNLKPET